MLLPNHRKDAICALLWVLVSKHGWGKPLPKDFVVRCAALPSDQIGEAKTAFEDLRRLNFVVDCGPRGVYLDPSEFGNLIMYLHRRCGYSETELRPRIHHFEGWEELELDGHE